MNDWGHSSGIVVPQYSVEFNSTEGQLSIRNMLTNVGSVHFSFYSVQNDFLWLSSHIPFKEFLLGHELWSFHISTLVCFVLFFKGHSINWK